MFRIVKDDMPPLPQGLSGELNDFLQTCFSKDPSARPAATELFDHIWLKKYCPDLVRLSYLGLTRMSAKGYSPPFELKTRFRSSDGSAPISEDLHWTLATMVEVSNLADSLMLNRLPLVPGRRWRSSRYPTVLAGLARKPRKCII